MPLTAERKAQFEEAFEILGKKAAEVDRNTMGDIMRSLGQNPMDSEVKELFEKVAGGAQLVTCEKVLAAATEFEDRMGGTDQLAAIREAFAVFDKDKTGSISAAYAHRASRSARRPLSLRSRADTKRRVRCRATVSCAT